MQFLSSPRIPTVIALPGSGAAGEFLYYNSKFYGWTGSSWKALNNDATVVSDVAGLADALATKADLSGATFTDNVFIEGALSVSANFTAFNFAGSSAGTNTGDQNASTVPYAPVEPLTGATVQAALDELAAKYSTVQSEVDALELDLGDNDWENPINVVGTGTEQVITLPEAGLAKQQVLVFVNGIRYPTSEYTISGTNLIITTTASGDSIEVIKASGGGNAVYAPPPVKATTGSYTPNLSDSNGYIELTNASPANFTVPDNATVAFAVGTEIALEQGGTGTVNITAAGGVILNYASNHALATNGRYSVVHLKKKATNTWIVYGNLAAA